ncbi:MAG: hypothetical protein ACI825_001446 [Planctomycetota bacterium]
MIQRETYKFSACNGPGVGANQFSDVDASGLDAGSTCEITFTASASGTYLLVINETANCGVAEALDNGFLKIEWVEV